MAFTVVNTSPTSGAEMERADDIRLPRRPSFGRLEATRFRRAIAYGDRWAGSGFTRRFADLCRRVDARIVHAIPHGPEFWYAYLAARDVGARYVLNVHDDLPYNLPHVPYLRWAMERLGDAWRNADSRFVISEPMGRALGSRYGQRPYTVVTDGLEKVPDAPRSRPAGRLRVYLMGSVHLSYEPNFHSLFQALALVRDRNPDLEVSMVVRGGLPFDVDAAGVPVDVRAWGSQEDVHRDLDEVDALYLPLPFDQRHSAFVRYSLATKLVTYLGAGLPIVFHGPQDSAAGSLLRAHEAGALATEVDSESLARAMEYCAAHGVRLSAAALDLARRQFMADQVRAKYWLEMRSLETDHEVDRTNPAVEMEPA
jgi:glycosyltransferase involved in cell wall biosynthesis